MSSLVEPPDITTRAAMDERAPLQRLRNALDVLEQRLDQMPRGALSTSDALNLISTTMSLETRIEMLEDGLAGVEVRAQLALERRRFNALAAAASILTGAPAAAPAPPRSAPAVTAPIRVAPAVVAATHPAAVLTRLGRSFIAVGVVLASFFAFEFGISSVAQARDQTLLLQRFEDSLATSAGKPPRPSLGDPVALLEVPEVGIRAVVVEGTSPSELKKGPGHMRNTPLPGQPGNAVIAGRRTTYGATFAALPGIKLGQEIEVSTEQGRFVYVVEDLTVIERGDEDVVGPSTDNRLTLVTSHPSYLAKSRLAVVASLKEAPVPARAKRGEVLQDHESGLAGDPRALAPTLLWLEALLVLAWLGRLAAARWSRWTSYVLVSPIAVMICFLLFESVDRLLPATV